MAKFAAKDSNKNITLSPHGTGKVVVGTGAADATVQSDGNHNLVLQTGNSTTGSISITDGADGKIALAPNGTGEIVVGNGGNAGKITSYGTYDLELDTNAGTDSGRIKIIDGANQNIDIVPNGTGSAYITKVDIDGGTIDGVTIGTNDVVTDLRVDNLKMDSNTLSSTNTNGDINLTPDGTGDVVASNASNASTIKTTGAGGVSAETAFVDLGASSASDGNVMARIKGIRGGGTGDTEGHIAFSVKSAANTITERLRISASGSITTPNSTEFNGSIGDSATVSTTQKQSIVQAGPGSGTFDVSSGTLTTSTAQKNAIVDGATGATFAGTISGSASMASSGVTVRNIEQVALASDQSLSADGALTTFFSPTYDPKFSGSKVMGCLNIMMYNEKSGGVNARKQIQMEFTGSDITNFTFGDTTNPNIGAYDYGSSGIIVYYINTIMGPLLTTSGTSTIT